MSIEPVEDAGSYQSGPGRRQTFGTLLGRLVRETSELLRKELRLARAEMSEKVSQAVSGSTSLAAGAALLFCALLALLAAAVLGLDEVMSLWLAALVVAVVVLLVGALILFAGLRKLRETRLAPQRTIESVRENMDVVRERV